MSSRIEEAHKLFAQNMPKEAESLYHEILARDPGCVEAMLGLGLTWAFNGSESHGNALLEVANELVPNNIVVKGDLAVSLMKLKRFDEALALIDEVLAVDATNHLALNNKGLAYKLTGRSPLERVILHTMAIRSAEARNQSPWTTYISRADAYIDLGDFIRALTDLNHIIANIPNDPLARFNRSVVLLSCGNYLEGLKEYRWRFKFFLECDLGQTMELPIWEGEDISGKNLLVYNEQGFGDMVMLLRYMPVLRDMGANVTLMIRPEVSSLSQHNFPWLTVVHDVSDISGFDYRCPMFEMLPALGQTPDNIPSAPYLQPSQQAVEKWRAVLPGERKRMGIAWSGREGHARDFQRSIPINDFIRYLNHNHLLVNQDYELISLQPVKEAPDVVRVLDIENFDDVASIASLMDAVVAVDTAAAHVAGAIGHPNAHVLHHYAQDWRWYNARSWYQTLHHHRQSRFGDWPSAFASLSYALK